MHITIKKLVIKAMPDVELNVIQGSASRRNLSLAEPPSCYLLADEEAFNLLLELAEESEISQHNEAQQNLDPLSYIPASDGELSEAEDHNHLLSTLAEEAGSLEPVHKNQRASVPGVPLNSEQCVDPQADCINCNGDG